MGHGFELESYHSIVTMFFPLEVYVDFNGTLLTLPNMGRSTHLSALFPSDSLFRFDRYSD